MSKRPTKTAAAASGTRPGPPPCPYCSGHSHLLVTSTDRNRGTTGQDFDYFQCSVCGLVFLHPVPADMQPFYAGGYAEIPNSVDDLRDAAEEERYRLEPVLRYKTGGRLLEIGPWHGVFSLNAREAGFEVTAIEMDARCVRFLNDQTGIRAVQSIDPAEALASMPERFDVIALWHSLEHLPEPWRVLEAAAARLAAGGILLVALPNIESYEFSALRDRWFHLDAPRHLYFYPPASLQALCEKLGLRTLEMTTDDHLSHLLGTASWRHHVEHRFGRGLLREGAARLQYKLAMRGQMAREHGGAGLTAIFQAPGGEASG